MIWLFMGMMLFRILLIVKHPREIITIRQPIKVLFKNREIFQNNPEKFAPQFGGFCAMGVALNKKLDTDPTAWKIVNGKLYLNLNKAVQKKWLSDVPTYLETANRVWSGIQGVSIAQLNAD
jgi:hypothetical protein